MLDPHFVILGALIGLGTGITYVIHVLQGKAQPNLVTWVLWAIAPLIAFAAQLGQGVGIQSLMTFMVGFMPLLVVIAACISKKAVWQLTRFDICCGILSILGLCLWIITKEGNVAIFFSIVADGLAALPTVVKAYRFPHTESWIAFLGGIISAGITLLTIDTWTFAYVGFPLYILTVNTILVLLIRFEFGKRLAKGVVN